MGSQLTVQVRGENTWSQTKNTNFLLLFKILSLHWGWYTPTLTTAELGLNPETNHEILVTYFRTCTLAWGLSCPVAFVSICWLICCLLALFLSSRIRLLQFVLRYIRIETGQHFDLLLKQICYLWFSNVPVVYKVLHLFRFFFQYRKCVFPGQEFDITYFFSTQFSLLLLLCAVLITFHIHLSFSFVSWSQFSVILVTQAPYDFADGTFRQTLKP